MNKVLAFEVRLLRVKKLILLITTIQKSMIRLKQEKGPLCQIRKTKLYSFFHVTKKGSLPISEGESVPDNYGVEPEDYI